MAFAAMMKMHADGVRRAESVDMNDLIQQGAQVRFQSLMTHRNLRITKDGDRINCHGGDGKLTLFTLGGNEQHEATVQATLVSQKFIGLPEDGGMPAPTDEAQPLFLDADDSDGTVYLVNSSKTHCLATAKQGPAYMVPREKSPATQFRLMVNGQAMNMTDEPEEEPEEEEDADFDYEDLEERFGPILDMPRPERRAAVRALDLHERIIFRQFKMMRTRQKMARKRARFHKRVEMGHQANEAALQAKLAALEARCSRLEQLANESASESESSESSEDEVDDEEYEAQLEAQARLTAEAAEAARLEAEAAEAARQEAIRQAEAEAEAMAANQRRLQEEAEAALAAALEAEAEEEEPVEVPEEEKDVEIDEATELATQDQMIERRLDLPEPEPSITANPDFDAEASAIKLRKAFKGFGCDKTAVREVIFSINNEQRQTLAVQYKTTYGRDLIKDLNSELGGKFRDLVLAAMDPPADFDAKCLRNAMKGLGTADSVLIEVLCTRTNSEIAAIKEAYQRLFNRELEADIQSETGGSYKRLLISMLAGGRDESTEVDEEKAKRDAELLQKNVCGWSRDESVLNSILAVRSPRHIRLALQEYENLTGYEITKRMRTFLSSHLAQGYIAIVSCCRNPARFFAQQIDAAFRGLGMDEAKIIRIFVSRSERDLASVRALYEEVTGTTLHEAVRSECTQDFRRALNDLGAGH